jgi:membrane peptidoglycan carboxypeptidase
VSLDEVATDVIVDHHPLAATRVKAGLIVLAASVLVGALVAAATMPFAAVAETATTEAGDYWASFPSDLTVEAALPQHTVLLDKDGVEFARFYSENRIDVTFDQISPNFSNALVATEDARFYEHTGVDFIGIARAAIKNFVNNNTAEGGSTITQQLVQNILVSNATTEEEKEVAQGTSYESKVREVKYAVNLEKTMTKQEILAAYSNAVFLGNQAYGVQAAARVYFDTDAASLTIPQAAMLVALLKSPVYYDPYVYPEEAQARRDIVIDRMYAQSYITEAEATEAKATPITLVRGSIATGCAASAYPYYCSLVSDELQNDEAFGATAEQRQETFRRGGITITTALDRTVADASQRAVEEALGNDNRVKAGTAVVVPGSGHIAAVAENTTWDTNQIVYATSAFQTGSVFKPITLAAGLESGLTLDTRYTANGPYFPDDMTAPAKGFTNFGNSNYGSINASTAIRQSVNVYFVKMIEEVGVIPVVEMANRLGIHSIDVDEPGLDVQASVALGTKEVSPLEMATAYATFAAGGYMCDPIAIVSAVRTSTGVAVETPSANCHQEISAEIAAEMDDVLQGTFRGGTLSSVGSLPGRETGGKTGTTDDSTANWTVGMTPQFATAVWVGDPRGGSEYPLTRVEAYGRTYYRTTGSAIAGPIWKSIMSDIHVDVPIVDFPNG